MRDESIACLRTQPPSPPLQRTGAMLMQCNVESELMVSVQARALKAEKEAARLRTALQAAQHEAAMWRHHHHTASAPASAMQHSIAQPNPFVGSSLHTHSHSHSHAHAHSSAGASGGHMAAGSGLPPSGAVSIPASRTTIVTRACS